jgi:L-ascorbate metabolism protein UlaG (beta-lactamase superfamily)
MWKKRAKHVAVTIVAVLAVAAAVIAWLWSDRPDLDSVAWPAPASASAAVTDSVVVTWLGVTTLLFDDGETQILIDGFFSRPSLADIVLDRPTDNDAAMINYALNEYRMRRLAAIIPVHSHFDHAMDVGAIANRTSASVLGSESTAAVARGAGVPEDQITTVTLKQPYEFGRFTVTLLPSSHAPIGWRGSVPVPGTIESPLQMPQPISAWREGGSFTIVVSHPDGTTIVHGSAGLAVDALRDVAADAVMLGVGGLESLGKDYAEQYWQSLVTATGARSVYPIHFDDFTRPFGETVLGPKLLGDFVVTTKWFEAFRDRWDNETKLFMPKFGQPIAIYAQPFPEA